MNDPPKIIVLYAHPLSHRSRVNRLMAEAARAVPNVTVHDLYETYPDFDINVRHEQALLDEADLLVFQHPIQWYSMPSLLKEWVDVVLENGWAHGPGGTALHHKDFWLAATTGGADETYRESAYHGWDFSAFLPPFQQTAALCGMRWLAPYILHGAHQAEEQSVSKHVQGYAMQLASYPHWR
jgi:putative NADPH-quinone reductase